MKKSSSIKIGIVSVFGLALLAGCTSPEQYTRRCADKDNKLLDDSYCTNTTGRGMGMGHWVYMGRHASIRNGIISGHTTTQPSTGAIKSSTGSTLRAGTTSRGGFGSSGGSSFGG